MRSASAARASRDSSGWQAVKISRSNSSPISSSSAESKSGMACCSCSRSLRDHRHACAPASCRGADDPAPGAWRSPSARRRAFPARRCRPMLQRRHQCFLRQILRQRHVAQHPRQAGDQPRLLDAPDREDGTMGCRRPSSPPTSVQPGRRIRRCAPCIDLAGAVHARRREWRGPRRCRPSPACARGGAA